jgi:hypothetical protein
MRGRSPEKPEAYSLEYVEDFFGPSTTQDGRTSFAASRTVNVGQAPREQPSRLSLVSAV